MSEELLGAVGLIKERALKLALEITEDQIKVLARFLDHLQDCNQVTNLVADAAPRLVAIEHVVDALSVAQLICPRLRQLGKASLVDIGSGAGFPGLILAVIMPNLKVSLVESVEKKARFLQREANLLSLPNLEVVNQRAEDVAHQIQYRARFDFATARAVGRLDTVSELAIPMLQISGLLLLQKSSAQVEVERQRAQVALPKLAAAVTDVHEIDTEITGKLLSVIVVEKNGATPDRYPRPWKRMKAEPLGESSPET